MDSLTGSTERSSYVGPERMKTVFLTNLPLFARSLIILENQQETLASDWTSQFWLV